MHATSFDEPIFSATLTPYRSLGRRGFTLLMATILAFWFAGSAYFWTLGAWPVIGFGCLDIVAIYMAFRLNDRAARAREEVEVSRAAIVIRRIASNGRTQEFRFNPQWVKLEVRRLADEGVVQVILWARERGVSVGGFLNPADRESFARAFGAALATARR